MKKAVLSLLLICLFVMLFAEQMEVKRDRALLRNGPGMFFEIMAELPQGTQFNTLAELDRWFEIEVDSLRGYVSQKVIVGRNKSSYDPFKQMSETTASIVVSKHGMSAGIKGFADKYVTKYGFDDHFIDLYQDFSIDKKAYKQFRKDTYRNKSRRYYRRFIDLPQIPAKDFYDYEEEGLGLAIAASIAVNYGIYNNPGLTEYVNMVGYLLVEASDVYDMQFRFFILDTDNANAFACPGGIIFITRGMLDLIKTEAELAVILAHEIGHVAHRHALIELGERETWVKSDNAFAELDAELEDVGYEQPDEISETENELDEIAFQSYERVIEGRLDKYEKEADFYALKLAAKTGYKSWQIINILNRLDKTNSESGNQHYTQDQIAIRLQDLWKAVERMKFPDYLFDNKDRWELSN